MTKQANKSKSLDPLRAKKKEISVDKASKVFYGELQLTKQARYSIENFNRPGKQRVLSKTLDDKAR